MSFNLDKPDFAAGYYQSMTVVGIVAILSIIHQSNQVKRYIARTKWPKLSDLPERKSNIAQLESYDDYDDDDNNNQANSSIAIFPRADKIHYAPTVLIHKLWNYVIHILGVGDTSLGEIFIFILFIGINILFLVFPFQGASLIQTLNIRAAYIALANVAFVFPLATRNSIFLKLIGVPFERIIKYHRWVGRTIFILLTFHGSYQVQTSYNSLGSVSQALFGSSVNLYGFLAYLSLFIIVMMAHSVFRRLFFELFYWTHFGFIFFLIFGCLHQPNFITFTAIGITLYGIDRLIRFFGGLKYSNVTSMEAISSGVTRVIFEFQPYYEAGQYMFVNFSNLKPPMSLIAWHPISFSSAPSARDQGIHLASIHMKTQGSFTQNLYVKAKEGNKNNEIPLKVRVDGPYGRPSLDFKQYQTVILISGGIGITPMISILRDLLDHQVTASMPISTQSIYFLWVIPDINAHSWFKRELDELNANALSLPQNRHLLEIRIFLTRSPTTPSSLYFQGRPNIQAIMQDIKQFHGSGDIAVGVCGPSAMLKEVRSGAVTESDETCLFKVHCETFEL